MLDPLWVINFTDHNMKLEFYQHDYSDHVKNGIRGILLRLDQ
jgi:hypothetical protein